MNYCDLVRSLWRVFPASYRDVGSCGMPELIRVAGTVQVTGATDPSTVVFAFGKDDVFRLQPAH